MQTFSLTLSLETIRYISFKTANKANGNINEG